MNLKSLLFILSICQSLSSSAQVKEIAAKHISVRDFIIKNTLGSIPKSEYEYTLTKDTFTMRYLYRDGAVCTMEITFDSNWVAQEYKETPSQPGRCNFLKP